MSDPEMTTFGMYPNWGIEDCKAYAEQLRDKTRANRAVHAAECIEYLLSLVHKEWQGLTDEEVAQAMYRADAIFTGPMQFKFAKEIEARLKEKNSGI